MKKKIISAVAAIMALCMTVGYTANASTEQVNKIVYIKRSIMAKLSHSDLDYADIDKNGTIDIFDIIRYKHDIFADNSDIIAKFNIGDIVSYKGIVYATSYATGNRVEVDGQFEIINILTDKNLQCRIQLKNTGWIPNENVNIIQLISSSAESSGSIPAETSLPPDTSLSDVSSTSAPSETSQISSVIHTQPIHPPTTSESSETTTIPVSEQTTVSSSETSVHQSIFDDNAVYRIKNAGSGKYLNVDAGRDENNANIYQWEFDKSVEESFRIEYVQDNDTYIIRAMCSSNGTDKNVNIISTNISEGGNVELYSPLNTLSQQWQIIPLGDGKYKILSYADNNLAMTVNGNANGSDNRNLSTSAGNVYVSSYIGSDYQIWYFEED
ncbi:MAG: RICIN domain-containing protein [Oscillospiraceae bacterium]